MGGYGTMRCAFTYPEAYGAAAAFSSVADIRRWRTAERVMNAVIQDYAGTDIAVRAFDPDRDYWWPIPADQLLLNKNLVQNPNY